jgi:Uma2 family endonuclease
MATPPVQPLTEEEYLRIERAAFEKSEFHDGQMFAMAGGSPDHSLIGAEALFLLRGAVPTGCRVFNSDQRIHSPVTQTFTYANCIVVCGQPQFYGGQKDNLIIHQDRRFVEHHSKQDDGSWVLREHSGAEDSVPIDRLGLRISLADLYASALDLDENN